MEQNPSDPRLSLEEIKALIEAGDISQDNIGQLKMSYGERKDAMQVLSNGGANKSIMENIAIPAIAAEGLGLAIPVGVGALALGRKFLPKALPRAGKLIGGLLGSKMGHPWMGYEAGGALGSKLGKMFGAGEEVAAAKAPVKRVIGPMADRESMVPEIAEQVQRGVQNDFTGRVSFQPGPRQVESKIFGSAPEGAYSPNVSTGATADDIMEMLTGMSHGKGSATGTPVMYHGESGPATRSSVDKLKRATRRSPK